MNEIHTVGIVGCGLIGSGWASRCLARQLDVIAYDPSSVGESVLNLHVENAWYGLSKLGFERNNSGKLRFTNDLEDLVVNSDFIQESAPESIELKQALHKDIDKYANPRVIIASSSSGLLPSEIQIQANHPERILVGHPFNPVYILPLVEVVCGKYTAPENAQISANFYRSIGMYPLIVRKEVDGYISDRLQEAVWREALHIISDDIASTKDVDDAIIYGPGLRWAIMGVCLTFHLAGGEHGMKHMLEQFGPALQLPWTHLKAPELTDSLVDKMVDGTQSQAEGYTIQELERLRDNCLIEILDVLNRYNYAAGSTNYRAGSESILET